MKRIIQATITAGVLSLVSCTSTKSGCCDSKPKSCCDHGAPAKKECCEKKH